MASKKIQSTKNYRLFNRSDENRVLDLRKHKALEESMKAYGFLACFPVVCRREGDGKLVVKDGQHRLAIAEVLGLSVYWVEEDVDFDVAMINNAAKNWQVNDYALRFAANGNKDYQAGLDFAELHGMNVSISFALLAGQSTWSNIANTYRAGDFKVKDHAYASKVASIYGPMAALSGALANRRFIEACMAACRVEGFDPNRLLQGAEKCREKIVPYSTRDAYLGMMEEIYNFNRQRQNVLPLKFLAINAMAERNPKRGRQRKKEAGEGESGAA